MGIFISPITLFITCQAEGNGRETDLRHIVTNLADKTKSLYENVYCDRVNAELRIKDSKTGLHSDRTICHGKEANPFRLLLSTIAYQIMPSLIENMLKICSTKQVFQRFAQISQHLNKTYKGIKGSNILKGG